MKQRTTFVYLLVSILILSVISSKTYAQGPGFTDDTSDTVPVDGGLSLLVAAGVGYGAKKIKDAKSKKVEK